MVMMPVVVWDPVLGAVTVRTGGREIEGTAEAAGVEGVGSDVEIALFDVGVLASDDHVVTEGAKITEGDGDGVNVAERGGARISAGAVEGLGAEDVGGGFGGNGNGGGGPGEGKAGAVSGSMKTAVCLTGL